MFLPCLLHLLFVTKVTYLQYIWMKLIARKHMIKVEVTLGVGGEKVVCLETVLVKSNTASPCNILIKVQSKNKDFILVIKPKGHKVCNPRQSFRLTMSVFSFSCRRPQRRDCGTTEQSQVKREQNPYKMWISDQANYSKHFLCDSPKLQHGSKPESAWDLFWYTKG